MAVDSCEEHTSDHPHPVMILPEGTAYLPCEPHFSTIYDEVPKMLKSETCLNCEPNSKNGLDKVKGYDIEKGRADTPKPTEECVIKNSKNDDSRARTLLRDVSSQIGGKLMLLFMKNGTELPKFTSRERGYEAASNRSRKYKRTASFNSRRVVLISSALSIMGTIILIYLTLRARQISDGPSGNAVRHM